ncbi:hypothetical protein [Janibacter terrae]|uniref:hypothetical protein n=1 Tax=Janibacter terrae TaxID=103817 RepID=UPI0031F9C728
MNKNIIPRVSDTDPSNTAQIHRPAWADPTLDIENVDEETHPDDRGVWMKSQPVDQWTVNDEQNGRTFTSKDPVVVYVDGFRHYNRPDLDWPDNVRIQGDTDPGGDGSSMLPRTGRRLAAALVQAADLIEPPISRSWIAKNGGRYRLTPDARIESYQSHADEWRTCADLNIVGGNGTAVLTWGTADRDLAAELAAYRDELLDNAALDYAATQVADRLTELLAGGGQR